MIKQTRNKSHPKRCCASAALIIRRCVQRLNSSAKEILAKFKTKKGVTCHITNAMIAKHLKQCAIKAYGITSRK